LITIITSLIKSLIGCGSPNSNGINGFYYARDNQSGLPQCAAWMYRSISRQAAPTSTADSRDGPQQPLDIGEFTANTIFQSKVVLHELLTSVVVLSTVERTQVAQYAV
jgi:hypothetical protein